MNFDCCVLNLTLEATCTTTGEKYRVAIDSPPVSAAQRNHLQGAIMTAFADFDGMDMPSTTPDKKKRK